MSKNRKTAVEYLGWVFVSLMIWRWALVEVEALYPDWDENTGKMLGLLIRSVLVLSWSLWLVSFLPGAFRRLRLWFKIGICLSILLSIIRLIFYKEMNEFLDYLLQK
jgi:hypothetical protein